MAANRIRYHLDEHLPNALATGLRRYGIDVTTPSDVKLLTAADHLQLEYARMSGRVMGIYDADYLRLHRMNIQHTGIAFIRPGSCRIGRMVELLHLLYELALPEEMINRLEYI